MIMKRWRKQRAFMLLITLLAVLTLILGACGGNDNDGDNDDSNDNAVNDNDENVGDDGNETSVEDSDSWLAGLPPPSAGALRLPIIENATGSLAFMQGNALYAAHFDGEPAMLLDTYVNHYSLHLAPDRHTLSYVAALAGDDDNESELVLKLVDLYSLEERTLMTVTGSTSRVLSWSPAGEHMLMVGPGNGGLSIVDVDGSTVETLIPAQATSQAMVPDPEGTWLDDGRVLFLASVDGISSNLQAMVYDPATQKTTPVNVTLDENSRDLLAIEENLRGQNLNFPPTYRHINRTVPLPNSIDRATIDLPSAIWNFQTQACDTWAIRHIQQGGTIQSDLYTSETTYLADLTLLPDESMLFLEWQLPNCSLNTNLQISLKQLTLDGDVETLTEDISPQFDGNYGLLLYHDTHRYDVTPDGRYIVWLSGDIGETKTGIAITDLETGQSAAFIETIARSEASSFLNLFWIPNPPEAEITDTESPSTESESE